MHEAIIAGRKALEKWCRQHPGWSMEAPVEDFAAKAARHFRYSEWGRKQILIDLEEYRDLLAAEELKFEDNMQIRYLGIRD